MFPSKRHKNVTWAIVMLSYVCVGESTNICVKFLPLVCMLLMPVDAKGNNALKCDVC